MKAVDAQKIIRKQKEIFGRNFEQSEIQILDSLTDVFTGFTEVNKN